MANDSDQGSATGAIGALSLFLLGPILLIVFIVGGMNIASAQPNSNGSVAPQKQGANPATAPSAIAKEMGDFSRFSDVNGYLQKNGALLSNLQSVLGTISAKLTADKPYTANGVTISATNVDKIITIIKQMNSDLTNIQTQVAAGAPQNATKYTTDLTNNLQKLQTLSSNGSNSQIVQVATDLINYNKNGTGPIKYSQVYREVMASNGMPLYEDCSSFVSYVLQKVHILPLGVFPDVQTFASTYATTSNFTNVDSAINGQISETKILSEVQPGDLLLSNTGDSVLTNSNGRNYISIYLGVLNGVPTIGESTTASSTNKSGPQFDTLDDRVQHHGHIQMILRPNFN